MMADARDPLSVLLGSVRLVGDEYCWPASEAVSVIRALGALGLVILGGELWRLEDGSDRPTVLGWTEYEIPSGEW